MTADVFEEEDATIEDLWRSPTVLVVLAEILVAATLVDLGILAPEEPVTTQVVNQPESE